MAQSIAAAVEGRVAASGAERARRRPTADLVAYDYFLQGREQLLRNSIEAEPLFARAVELDRTFAQAYALRVLALLGRFWTDPQTDTRQEAFGFARRALSLDEADPWCQVMMGFALTHLGRRDEGGPYSTAPSRLIPATFRSAISFL